MNDKVISVIEIIAENFKTGHSDKTGKDWSLSKYKASNGIEFSSFDKLEIGDVVRLEQSGQYWNGAKPRKDDIKHDEIMDMLNKIFLAVSGSQEMKKPAQTATSLEQARAQADKIRPETKNLGQYKEPYTTTNEFSDADMPDFGGF